MIPKKPSREAIKVWNSLNAHLREKNYAVNTLPSLTIPDQTMTLRELMTKHTQGIPFDVSKQPIFDPDTDEESVQEGVDMRTLDLVDIQILKQDNIEKIEDLQKIKRAMDREAHEKQMAEKEAKLKETWLKEQQDEEKGRKTKKPEGQ